MEEGVQRLQKRLAEVEAVADEFLLARQQLVECDRLRNGNREALTALRKQARTSRSSVLSQELEAQNTNAGEGGCLTCGEHDGTAPVWVIWPGSDMFVRHPFHRVHGDLEEEQEKLELAVKKLQSVVKDNSLTLSEKGGLSDRISPNLLKAFVTLDDKSS